MYKDYIYEVRGANDPIDGDSVIFETKQDALTYADSYPEAEVYQVEITVDDESGSINKTGEIQVRGAEVDANLADPNIPNSCDADNPDCYDENGNFRLPVNPDDDLEEDFTAEDEYIARKLKQLPNDRYKVVKTKSFKTEEEAVNFAKQNKYDDVLYKQHIMEDGKDKGGLEGAVWIAKGIAGPDDNIEEGYDDRRGHDPINRRERVNMDTLEEELNKITTADEAFDYYVNNWLDCTVDPDILYNFFKLGLDGKTLPKNVYDKYRWDDTDYIESIYKTGKDIKANGLQAAIDNIKANLDPTEDKILIEADEDISDEEFAEALYNALAAKREEDAFPEGELDMDPPHDDVPVVKCKVSDLVTHAEDEKPVKEYPDNLFEEEDPFDLDWDK